MAKKNKKQKELSAEERVAESMERTIKTSYAFGKKLLPLIEKKMRK